MSIPEFTFRGTPLTTETMMNITGLIMNSGKEQPLNEAQDLKGEFAAEMILKRIKAYELKFTISDFFLVASLTTFANNPVKLMIMLWLAFQYHKKTGKDFLGIQEWCEIFPVGTPNETEMQDMWESQKTESPSGSLVNMLDNVANWA